MSKPDFIYLSLGGGVQSGTIAEMIVEGELPKPDMVIFADTHDEPKYVYDHMDYLRGRLASVGLDVKTVSGGDLVANLMTPRGGFAAIPAYTVNPSGRPAILKRQCTSEYKIIPIEKALKAELVKRGLAKRDRRGVTANKGLKVHAWIGISKDEAERMKPNRTKWIDNRWPLIELDLSPTGEPMTRHDCRKWLDSRDLPIPGRSSCRVCPYHNNSYWRDMRDYGNGDWEHAVEFDKSLRDYRSSRFVAITNGLLYLHKDLVPLDEVDLRTVEEKGQLRLFEDETDLCDGGYCFV